LVPQLLLSIEQKHRSLIEGPRTLTLYISLPPV
jgi:hypothetical protein